MRLLEKANWMSAVLPSCEERGWVLKWHSVRLHFCDDWLRCNVTVMHKGPAFPSVAYVSGDGCQNVICAWWFFLSCHERPFGRLTQSGFYFRKIWNVCWLLCIQKLSWCVMCIMLVLKLQIYFMWWVHAAAKWAPLFTYLLAFIMYIWLKAMSNRCAKVKTKTSLCGFQVEL